MAEKKDERGFYQRLIDAMKEMENPTKSKQAYKYKYETLEQVLGIIRPALANNGLMLTQYIRQYDGEWVLETVVFDGNGDEKIMDVRPIPLANDAQAQGSWETYLRRYALRSAFGLTGEDDDGEATKQKGGSNVRDGAPSEKQIGMLRSKLAEFANLKGISEDEAAKGLFNSNAVKGATWDTLTKRQASDAISQLIVWISKLAPAEPELYDEDQEF